MNIIVILIAMAAAWFIRGKFEEKKRNDFIEERRAIKEGATLALRHLRMIYQRKPSENLRLGYKLDSTNWNHLVSQEKISLAEIGTCKEEIQELFAFHELHFSWAYIMQKLEQNEHSEEYFNDCLAERQKLLDRSGRTLADFSVNPDDTADLKKAFHRRRTKYIARSQFKEVVDLERGFAEIQSSLQYLGLHLDSSSTTALKNNLRTLI